jgi:hypothetical protein
MTFLLIVCLGTFITAPLIAADFDIQSEVDNAATGSTVNVPAGTYAVNLVINKSINLVADGEVTLTRPWTDYDTEYHDTILVQTEEVVNNPEDMPVITCLDSGAVTIDGFAFAQPVSGDLSGEYWQGEYTTIGILAGSGVDLTVNNCTVGADFYAPVVVTTWEDVFNQALGNVNDSETVGDFFSMADGESTSSLTMNGCNFSNYDLAGVVLLGEGVTAEISNNNLNGEDMEKRVLAGDANMAMQEVAELGLSAVSGSLFANVYLPATGVGVLVVNSNDDQVIMKDNMFTHNLAAVAAIKEVSQSENTSLVLENQAAVEAGEGLSIESGNTFTENILGVVALGGLDVLLEWNVVSTDLLISPDIAWESTSAMPLFIQDTDFTNNIVGTILAGKVKATVDDNLYSGDLAADLVGIGDLSESYITGNEFNGTTGASMVFALQKADIEGALEMLEYSGTIEEGSLNIDQQGTLTVSGNTITGNGPIENAHEFLFGPEPVVEQAMALGQRTADYGPLAILPSPAELDDDDDDEEIGPDDISIAGIVLLDGARKISIEENTIAGTLLGITAIDTGIVENIQEIDITDNRVEGNICGLTLVGAGQILVPLAEAELEEDLNLEENLNSEAFLSADNKLVLGEVSGNHFDENHIGMISALSVEGEIHNNYFDDNALLGMVHIGIGDWVLGLTGYVMGYGSTEEIIGDIYPELNIKRNNITGNGINPDNGPAFLNEVISDNIKYKDMLCGGILVIDCAKTDGLTINENNIAGNGSYGIITTTRKSYTEYPFAYEAEETTESEILDATSNWWGDPSGPGSYAPGSQTAPGYSDPVTKTIANGSGDPIGTFLVGIDGVYVPYSISASESSDPEVEVLFFSPEENIINFSKYSSTEFPIEPVSSSGGGSCGVASFTPSLLLLLAPLAFMLRRK